MSHFTRFGLLVTGKAEQKFLPKLFRALTTLAACHFEVIRKIDQLSARTSPKKHLRMPGRGGKLPSKDEQIGLAARNWLRDRGEHAFVMLVDDLEYDRQTQHQQIFDRYRDALGVMHADARRRVGVFFLVMMLEAYYFADRAAVEAALGLELPELEPGEDVEKIRHPKRDLERRLDGFKALVHGEGIVARLDLATILADPRTCASLRTAIAWCHRALGLECGEQFQLAEGDRCPVTGPQIGALE
jgi:hypothetical protein